MVFPWFRLQAFALDLKRPAVFDGPVFPSRAVNKFKALPSLKDPVRRCSDGWIVVNSDLLAVVR